MPADVLLASEEKTVPPLQSRAREIFKASEEAKSFNPADLDFAMLDEEPAVPVSVETSPAQPLPRPAAPGKNKRILGMTVPQLILIVALAFAFLCLLAIFAVLYLAGPSILQFLGLS